MRWLVDGTSDAKSETASEPVERQVHNRSCVERKQLTQNEPTDDGDAKRAAELRAYTATER